MSLLALGTACSSAPAAPSPSQTPSQSPSAARSGPAAAPSAAPWRALPALTPGQLPGTALPVADLPPGTRYQDFTRTSAPDPERWRLAAAGNPDCAPVINALAPPSGPYAEHGYVSGGSAGDVLKARVTAVPGAEARGRFDTLRDAVHGGRCTTLRLSAETAAFQLEPMPVDGPDVPTVGLRLRTTSGGGTVLLVLYAAVGENSLLFSVSDEAQRKPALRTDLVTAQINRVLATS
ncbi:hypothetical protein ACIA8O_24960 [Kitasatospora sp. NPDC051853]|uniref:hypothetical protein n=1 Tax=Kitasatospora sp. NPDC051853 TaxID=3364058 RepID=UPI00379DA550